jgi:carboxypeptidase Q
MNTSANWMRVFGMIGLSLWLSAGALAQPSAATSSMSMDLAEVRQKALAETLAFNVLESLTTEVGPRMAGTPGDASARVWAIAKLKELGFEKVYSEPVQYPVWERGRASCEVVKPYPQRLELAALGGSIGTGNKPLLAEVMMFDSVKALTDAKPESAVGKIVFINQRMLRSKDGSSYGPVVMARVAGASLAAKIGAKAVLIRSVGTDANSRSPHTGVMRYDNMLTRIPAAALGNADADLLERMILRGQPVRLKLDIQARTRKGQYTGANIIGEFTGSEFPEQIVAIGGHLDSWDLGTGALDDGAGVAMTIAAAKLVTAQKRPKRTIRVVLFANEEQGVFGGKAYAESAKAKAEVKHHVIASESDFGSGRIYELSIKASAPEIAEMQPLFDALKPLGIEQGENDATGSADFGPIGLLGAPVADLKQDGTHYFDIHHTANDTLDKVDQVDLAQNVAAWAVFTYFFANR